MVDISTRTPSSAHDSLIQWYKSHQVFHGQATNVLHTEDSENEYLVEESRFVNTACSILWNPYARCYYEVKKIRAYRHYVKNSFEEAYRAIRWIDLPGGQHQLAIDRNYIANFIWVMCFITADIDTTNKEATRTIRARLEDILFHAENLGIMLQEFFRPLRRIAQSHSMLEEMGEQVQVKIARLPVERKIFRLPLRPDYTILPGNNIRDFDKLVTYCRKDVQIWTKFKALTEAEKIDIVTKGLTDISENIKDLRVVLKRPLKTLRKSSRGCCMTSLFQPSLFSHCESMRDSVKRIVSDKKCTKNDKEVVEALLSELEDHYSYIMRYGELLVEEVWDIVLMSRLSYNFIKESSQNNIMVAAPESVIVNRFKPRKIRQLLKASAFSVEDFFLVDCPDTLRKLPVVIFSKNVELCLHLQGHKNSTRSTRVLPSHKRFTMKRFQSIITDKAEDKLLTSQEPSKAKLLFVSGE